MGSPEKEEGRSVVEGPQHEVAISKPFAVGKFTVTFAEWDACVQGGGCPKAADSDWGRDNRPVINVSWDDANAYVTWLTRLSGKPYRLLSEAEWEYAARAGTKTKYWWGDDIGEGNANCSGCKSLWHEQTAPVGSFKPNAFGLYDMHGNVWQWVEDCWHKNHDGAPNDGSAWITGDCSLRVVRGGSWYNLPQYLRAAYRFGDDPGYRLNNFGFRLARTITPIVNGGVTRVDERDERCEHVRRECRERHDDREEEYRECVERRGCEHREREHAERCERVRDECRERHRDREEFRECVERHQCG